MCDDTPWNLLNKALSILYYAHDTGVRPDLDEKIADLCKDIDDAFSERETMKLRWVE